MDPIIKHLNNECQYNYDRKEWNDLWSFCRVKVDYIIIIFLSQIWYEKFKICDPSSPVIKRRNEFIERISKASMGNLLRIGNEMHGAHLFSSSLYEPIKKFINLRNDEFAHGGLVLQEASKSLAAKAYEFVRDMDNVEDHLVKSIFDIWIPQKQDNQYISGIISQCNNPSKQWIRINKGHFDDDIALDSVYLLDRTKDAYSLHKLSPFIKCMVGQQIEPYRFLKVEDSLNGQTKYANIYWEGEKKYFCNEFKIMNYENGNRIECPNGVIRNKYNDYISENYDVFLQTNYTQMLSDKIRGVLSRKADVCLTLHGNGGVGKTALVLNILNDYSITQTTRRERLFDYIIFLTAKIDYMNNIGRITQDKSSSVVKTYDGVVQCINETVFGAQNPGGQSCENETNIRNKSLLLCIDDLENFPREERVKIDTFIKNNLNAQHHKVIITCRTNIVNSGQSLPVDELDENTTWDFATKAFKHYFEAHKRKFDDYIDSHNDRVKLVYHMTGGIPLFILIFNARFSEGTEETSKIFLSNAEKLYETESALKYLINNTLDNLESNYIKILYVISLLINEDEMENQLDRLIYILLGAKPSDEDMMSLKSDISLLEKRRIMDVQQDTFVVKHRMIAVKILNSTYVSEITERQRMDYKNRFKKCTFANEWYIDDCLLEYAKQHISDDKNIGMSNFEEVILFFNARTETSIKAYKWLCDYLKRNSPNDLLSQKIKFSGLFDRDEQFIAVYSETLLDCYYRGISNHDSFIKTACETFLVYIRERVRQKNHGNIDQDVLRVFLKTIHEFFSEKYRELELTSPIERNAKFSSFTEEWKYYWGKCIEPFLSLSSLDRQTISLFIDVADNIKKFFKKLSQDQKKGSRQQHVSLELALAAAEIHQIL